MTDITYWTEGGTGTEVCSLADARAAVAAAREVWYSETEVDALNTKYHHSGYESGCKDGLLQGQRDALAAIQEAWDAHKRGNYHFVKCERCKGYRAARLAIKGGSE
jgi:hypothetical protein